MSVLWYSPDSHRWVPEENFWERLTFLSSPRDSYSISSHTPLEIPLTPCCPRMSGFRSVGRESETKVGVKSVWTKGPSLLLSIPCPCPSGTPTRDLKGPRAGGPGCFYLTRLFTLGGPLTFNSVPLCRSDTRRTGIRREGSGPPGSVSRLKETGGLRFRFIDLEL